VQHQQTGWVIPVDDAAALTKAMTALINDETLRRALGSRAAATARVRFDAEQNYQALIQRVAQAAAERRALKS
jgi:glycosyltransferase involved in cell wall biosynthesis